MSESEKVKFKVGKVEISDGVSEHEEKQLTKLKTPDRNVDD